MICLIIILSILLVLFLISLLNIKLIASYKEKLSLVIKILFIKIDLSPKEEKKKKPEKKPKKKKEKKKKEDKKTDSKKSEKKEKKKKNPFKILWEKQGISGFVELLKDVLKMVKGVLKRFFRRLVIQNFELKISFAGEDASDTATGYGALCATVYPLMGQLYSRLNVKDYSVDITCNFNNGAKTEIDCSLYATIRICHILSIALRAAARAVKTYLKMRF